MDIISIQCPHCGAGVERKKDAYFGTCPYCGSEVCFDDAKAEAEAIGLRGKVSDLDKRLNAEKQYKAAMKLWIKKRNRMYTITSLLFFLGFLAAVVSDDEEGDLIAIGVMLIMIALFSHIVCSILKCANYPLFRDEYKDFAIDNVSKTGLLFKTIGMGFLLMGGAAFCSAILYAIIHG
ncbi:MAG: IBR domain-containing protein [Ruminococcus sp.]|uniref:hypothetical protein n=1 Tax=Ruminococcus sp. TaxID=41978 RepID=UPI0025FFA8FB|nr:hypothetical protein [Ruminococcus sp.]MCR5601426.1 IBR domain-containing protein [Ruminococcus sp.]